MIIPILCVTGPANWRLAQQIKAQLETAGHEGQIHVWRRSIPNNEGAVIYLGRLDAKTVAKANRGQKPVKVIAINPETTTIDQIDFDQIFGLSKTPKEKSHGTERKPRRRTSE